MCLICIECLRCGLELGVVIDDHHIEMKRAFSRSFANKLRRRFDMGEDHNSDMSLQHKCQMSVARALTYCMFKSGNILII